MADALIGLGGNVGDARAVLDEAVRRFCDGAEVKLAARSADYRTAPWGVLDQPDFVNLCLRVETGLPPRALLARALAVEASLGRNRAAEKRWGPRIVDIDLLAYDDVALDEPGLILPHPRLAERAFVLVPLREIAPDWRIGGESVGALAARLDAAGVERLAPVKARDSLRPAKRGEG
ncbi:MAG TPA: 2-amino-4-hydroxy-6-hydroxymethyldihydropteridine diphosphokinase, partial [Roseiarcus sp.]|nr:2-amino-4-hydroxy-6-hydroxymethyldihydropteridine diphosphokinase [Roseiarcus sp.]